MLFNTRAMLAPEILEEYRRFCVEIRKLAAKTVTEYIRVIESLSDFDLLRAAGPAEIDQAIIDLSTRNGWCDRYAYKYSAVLKTFYQWLFYRQLTDRNPYVYSKIRKPKPKEPDFITQAEFDLIYDSIKTSPLISGQDMTILKLLWDTGLRRSEISAIDRDDILLEDSVIQLPMKKTKGQNRSRFLPFTPECAALITEQMNHSEMYAKGKHLFLNEDFGRMSPRGIYSRVHKIAMLAEKQIRPHMLRHSLGVRILDNGGDIGFCAKLLGHETLNTTLHYLNIGKTSAKKNYDKILVSS